ncbi:MAG: hypothetical protein LCH81_19145 [Bacteroidetes bacterium]|nr:hypothetical protein [Bacteroidota bacterium]
MLQLPFRQFFLRGTTIDQGETTIEKKGIHIYFEKPFERLQHNSIKSTFNESITQK